MSKQDLSLLTDIERGYFGLAEVSADGLALRFARALIAARADLARLEPLLSAATSAIGLAEAENNKKQDRIAELRAENKRLLDGTKEVLADVEFSIKHSDDLGRKNTLSIVQEKLRALLQSEKERCPVHDFELPCLGCAELALRVGVDEQEQFEKGGE